MSASWSLRIPIEKLDTPRGVATGWAAISTDDLGEPVVDHDGEYIPVAELTKAAQHAFLNYGPHGAVGDSHRTRGGADLVESMVFDREKREALGFGSPKEGHPWEGWAVSFRLRNPGLLAKVRNGERQELSIRGTAESVDLETWASERGSLAKAKKSKAKSGARVLVNLELNSAEMFSVVDKGASGNQRVAPRIVLIKRKGKIMGFLSKFFKDTETEKTPIGKLKAAIADLEPEQQDGVVKAYSTSVFKLEGSPQQMLEAALAGLPEDKIAAIMAAFQLALQAPAAEPAKPAAPAPEPEVKATTEPEPDAVKAEGEEPKPEEMEKAFNGMSPEGRALISKMLESDKAKDEEIAKLRKGHEEEVAKRRKREAVAKAKELPAVPVTEEDLVELIIEAEELSEGAQTTLAKLLKDSNTAIQSGLLKQRGTTGASPVSGSPEAKVESKAKELMKSRPHLTWAQAKDEVWRANPELEREYRKNQESN